jgi:hypothetical protein
LEEQIQGAWYYFNDGQSYGPFPESELRRFVKGGILTSDTLVWSGSPSGADNVWRRAADTGLAALFNTDAPPAFVFPQHKNKPVLLIVIGVAVGLVVQFFMFALVVGSIILLFATGSLFAAGSVVDAAEATKITNDLRNLRSASLLFYGDTLQWPNPGEEAKLDHYVDRPIVGASPRKYAKVVISGKIPDSRGAERQYVGVELIPAQNGSKSIQKKLAEKAENSGLLQLDDGIPSTYRSGLNVYMNIR